MERKFKNSIKFNFPKFWARNEYVETFDVKYCCWVSNYKNKILLKKLLQIDFSSAPQSLILSYWIHNAQCKNKAWSNYPKRSLNWHLFLLINIDSASSWRIFIANSVCNVLFKNCRKFSEIKIDTLINY